MRRMSPTLNSYLNKLQSDIKKKHNINVPKTELQDSLVMRVNGEKTIIIKVGSKFKVVKG